MKALDLPKADCGIEITAHYDASASDLYDDDDPARTKVGVLRIGRGGLIWKGGHKLKAKRVSWSTFAYYMSLVKNRGG
jgi:hypothetical protein